MFIAYTDASVKDGYAALAFVIVFEDKSNIVRRITVKEKDSNVAEALAFLELLSFLNYYDLKKGLILFDSNSLKNQLKKGGRMRGLKKYLPKDIKRTLTTLELRTQVINRKYNIAHKVCYEDKFLKMRLVANINRSIFMNIPNYPQYYLQPSVFEEYKVIYNKRRSTYHEAQMNINKIIWLGDLIEEDADGIKMFANHDKRIKVIGDTIVKLNKINYVQISNHWRVFRKSNKLRKILIQTYRGENDEP